MKRITKHDQLVGKLISDGHSLKEAYQIANKQELNIDVRFIFLMLVCLLAIIGITSNLF